MSDEKRKPGRPRTEIDWEKVDSMCEIHCTAVEICSVLKISDDTLARACRREHGCTAEEYIEQRRAGGKESLRRLQWKAAEGGDRTMLVWLGKNWLNQTDKLEHGGEIKTKSTVIYLPDNGRDKNGGSKPTS